MKNYLAISLLPVFLILACLQVQSQNLKPIGADVLKEFIPCELYKDGQLIMTGFAKQPDMGDVIIKYKVSLTSRMQRLDSDEYDEILFNGMNNKMTYKGYIHIPAMGIDIKTLCLHGFDLSEAAICHSIMAMNLLLTHRHIICGIAKRRMMSLLILYQ
jgi:hypothetical protein